MNLLSRLFSSGKDNDKPKLGEPLISGNITGNAGKVKSALLGVAVGDALGVPVEFLEREQLKKALVTDMMGYGTHNQPAGTFSDDGSLTFCLAEALVNGCNSNEIAENFKRWLYHNYWTAHGNVFDIGIATHKAIERLTKGIDPELAGGFDISSNGNGSLMRILPLLFYIQNRPIEERYRITKQVSSITHGHVRSVISCFYYLEFARHLMSTGDLTYIYSQLKSEVSDFLDSIEINLDEIAVFDRLLKGNIYKLDENDIQSTGYVIHTLEASIWCLMTTNNYSDAVLKAVNLGSDTDTTAAVVGGLAGLLYSYENIPENWLKQLAKRTQIEDLAERLDKGLKIQSADFVATLKYKTTEEGGRQTPAASGYGPTIKFPFDEMMTSAQQTFIDMEIANPGDTIKAAIKMLSSPHFEERLNEGMEFDFREGDRIMGTGVITNIIKESLKKK